MRALAPTFVLPLVTLLLACGGGGGGAGAPTASLPTASFTSGDSAVAGATVAFDGSASSAPGGGALVYRWDFGDGQLGGTVRIAHAFAVAGSYPVTLTVDDGKGGTATASRSITVTAAAPPSATVAVHGLVLDLTGAPIAGAAVAPAGGGAGATADAQGQVSLTVGVEVDVPLAITAPGYADQLQVLHLPAGTGADASFEVRLAPRQPPLTLADAAAGGDLAGQDGVSVSLAAGALVDGAGAPVKGAVQVSMTPIDVSGPALPAFPGRFEGATPDGATVPIASLGTVEYGLSQGGQRLQLAPGHEATIELPVYADTALDGHALQAGDALPLWSLDERTGGWVQEGQGTLVASAASPTGLAFRASVGHFSWWNLDLPFDPYLPQPTCQAQGDIGVPGSNDYFGSATICNMLAQIGGGARGGALRAAAASALLPAMDASTTIPIAGGVPLRVPPGVNVVLKGAALNGLWQGQVTVNGPSRKSEVVVVPLTRVSSGGNDEVITLPFDSTRSLATGQVARFRFTAAASQWVQVTASQPNGSTLAGRVRLLQGTTALASGDFAASPATLIQSLPGAGDQVVEVTGTANTPGAYRLQVTLLGGVTTQAIALPVDLKATRGPYDVDRYTFDLAKQTGLGITFTSFYGQAGRGATLRLLKPDGTELTRQDAPAAATPFTWTLPPGAGYVLEVASRYVTPAANAEPFELKLELKPWAAVGPALGADGSFYHLGNVRLLPDSQGRPVAAYSAASAPGPTQSSPQNARIGFRRWDGTAWTALADDLPMQLDATDILRPCSGFALGAADAPIAVFSRWTAGQTQLVTLAERWVAGTGWQPIGPSGGQLSLVGQGDCTADASPAVVVGTDGQPIVALFVQTATSRDLYLLRFDGSAWSGLGASGGKVNGAGQQVSGARLALDPGGAPVLAWTDPSQGTTVVRYAGTPAAWQPIGPAQGLLADITVGSLTFDSSGHPVVTGGYGVCGSGGCHGEVGIYAFDGSAWTLTGPHVAVAGGYANDSLAITSVTDTAGTTVLWWEGLGSAADLKVERASGSTWTSLGDAGGSLGSGSAQSYYPSLLEDPSGNLLAGFSSPLPNASAITYQLYTYSP